MLTSFSHKIQENLSYDLLQSTFIENILQAQKVICGIDFLWKCIGQVEVLQDIKVAE